MGQNKTVSPQDPAATNRALRPSLSSPDNRLPGSDPTDPAVISPFKPQAPLESVGGSHILSFDQVVSRLKPLLDGKAEERQISIEGISPDIVDKLWAKARVSELPGWENLRSVTVFL